MGEAEPSSLTTARLREWQRDFAYRRLKGAKKNLVNPDRNKLPSEEQGKQSDTYYKSLSLPSILAALSDAMVIVEVDKQKTLLSNLAAQGYYLGTSGNLDKYNASTPGDRARKTSKTLEFYDDLLKVDNGDSEGVSPLAYMLSLLDIFLQPQRNKIVDKRVVELLGKTSNSPTVLALAMKTVTANITEDQVRALTQEEAKGLLLLTIKLRKIAAYNKTSGGELNNYLQAWYFSSHKEVKYGSSNLVFVLIVQIHINKSEVFSIW